MSNSIAPVTLIIDPDRGYHEWNINQLHAYRFWGNSETQVHRTTRQYVPNEDDAVWDWDTGRYRVTSVDYSTGICTLKKWSAPNEGVAPEAADLLLGTAPGSQSEALRLFINTSVTPFTVSFDSTFVLHGSDTESIKIFKGTNVGQNAQVVSAFYDQSDNYVGENIPLELTGYRNDNVAIKVPRTGFTNQRLLDGELCGVVTYGSNGEVKGHNVAMVQNTAFIRAMDAGLKHITAISVESPFISPGDPTLLQYPINMPIENLNLIGVVHYSDGSKRRLPVDGTKFSMHGLREFIATIQEQTVDLVLSYRLSEGEYSYIMTPSVNNHISVRYKATTSRNEAAYAIKLFGYPVWQDTFTGYRMEYFLASLERDIIYPVTEHVQLNVRSAPFDPKLYGVVQRIAVSLDLSRVDPRFAAYRHVQTFEVTLLTEGNIPDRDNWTMGFTPGQNPHFGVDLKATSRFINVNNWKVNLTSGIESRTEWLDRVYYAAQPLFDSATEVRAPAPNFFRLRTARHVVEVPIELWNSEITMHEVPEDGTVFLEFFRRNQTTDLELSVSGMTIHQIS